jgi:hypothetical protein
MNNAQRILKILLGTIDFLLPYIVKKNLQKRLDDKYDLLFPIRLLFRQIKCDNKQRDLAARFEDVLSSSFIRKRVESPSKMVCFLLFFPLKKRKIHKS